MNLRLFMAAAVIFLATGSARAAVLTVGDGGQFASVGNAIAAAHAGDTIRVLAGNYEEDLLVDKTLSIEGVGDPVIRGTGSGSVVLIAADNCVLRGFRIEHSGADLQSEDAGVLLRSNGNTVEGNDLRDILFGIYLYHSAGNTIRDNKVAGWKDVGVGERGAGLHLWNSPNNIIENNEITDARDGMYIQNSSGNTIRNNRVSNLRYGLHFMSSDNNSFEDNYFFDNVAGAAIMYSQNITLRRNAFVHNRGFSSFGILLQDCRSCLAEDNLILNNATGLFLEATRDSVFRRNTIAENDTALQVFSSSAANVFTENNFIGNLSPLQLVGRGGSIQWQTIAGGNYWSDYDGYDLDADSVGDIPHKIQNIFQYLEGNYPRLRIYMSSPAAQAMILAERSFPILKGSGEADVRPAMRPFKSDSGGLSNTETGRGGWRLLTISVLMAAISLFTFSLGRPR